MSQISLELLKESNQALVGNQSQFNFQIHYEEDLQGAPVNAMLLQSNQIVATFATEVLVSNEVELIINQDLPEGVYTVRLLVDNRFMLPGDESEQIEIIPNTVSNQLDQLTSQQREDVQEMAGWLQEQLGIQSNHVQSHPVELLINQRTGVPLNYWAGPESELPEDRDPNTIYDVWSED